MRPQRYFRIVAGEGASLAVVDQDDRPVALGEDVRNEREAMALLGEKARKEGLVLTPIRDESGHLTRIDASFDPKALRFSMESLREIDRIKARVGEIIRELTASK